MKPAKTPGSTTSGSKPAAADLVAKYRPVGLKAVLAAALQAKAKPAAKKLAKRPTTGRSSL
ncbi:hypothetical protein [Sinorhizobium sp. BJ1]|jgi:hypothetical protein|uniref:hypothetical protein n=1 Tax=Sinorhizobium sp. BJ1 TaxID=2035455 RepID=UPI000BEA20CE|nr:hypothetical protein [Sinorhizobium sp. BJ1]PDT85313.1 hypothetical protein CO676_04250 [Sinorhizobium sp. BJ1]